MDKILEQLEIMNGLKIIELEAMLLKMPAGEATTDLWETLKPIANKFAKTKKGK